MDPWAFVIFKGNFWYSATLWMLWNEFCLIKLARLLSFTEKIFKLNYLFFKITLICHIIAAFFWEKSTNRSKQSIFGKLKMMSCSFALFRGEQAGGRGLFNLQIFSLSFSSSLAFQTDKFTSSYICNSNDKLNDISNDWMLSVQILFRCISKEIGAKDTSHLK